MAGLAGIGRGNGTYAPELPLGWFVLIWLNDTGAYLAGRSLRPPQIGPIDFPRKNLGRLGRYGGQCFGGLLGVSQCALPDVPWCALALVVSVLGPAGDLTQSALKRRAGVKDSGTILPGHGGVLDRFDSHIFAAPSRPSCFRFSDFRAMYIHPAGYRVILVFLVCRSPWRCWSISFPGIPSWLEWGVRVACMILFCLVLWFFRIPASAVLRGAQRGHGGERWQGGAGRRRSTNPK